MIARIIRAVRAHKITAAIVALGTILGAVTTIWGFGSLLANVNWSRPALVSEVRALQVQLIELELDYRRRGLRSDLKSLREVDKEIAGLHNRNITVPDGLQEYRDGLQDTIEHNRNRIRLLEQASQTM
jgi:hypothetical protein